MQPFIRISVKITKLYDVVKPTSEDEIQQQEELFLFPNLVPNYYHKLNRLYPSNK